MATTTVWAIGDLHLSIGLESEKQKPMDQFGASWVQHTAKIARSWCERVQAQDIVLLAGDIFWGNRVEEARFALNWLGCLPGRKVLVRGNHDNWWQSIGKVRAALPPGMYAIQNDALLLDDVAISGARGWTFADPEGPGASGKNAAPRICAAGSVACGDVGGRALPHRALAFSAV